MRHVIQLHFTSLADFQRRDFRTEGKKILKVFRVFELFVAPW